MKGSPGQKGTGAILLAEDEDMVSELTKTILERSGYTVFTASNGEEALDLYEKERDRVALIILDLIMPGMGGEQCLEELRKIDPNVRIVVTSGYPINGATKETVESLANGFVGKPYNVNKILRAVRDGVPRFCVSSG